MSTGAGLTVVVDYGLCNVDSMVRALEECGASEVMRTRDPHWVMRADRVVLPGVGNFATAMANIDEFGLTETLREVAAKGRAPMLGACLGMQLMASSGMEGAQDGVTRGLALVEGAVVPLQPGDAIERIPHIGWNEVTAKPASILFKDIPPNRDFYFVHSYHFRLRDHAHEAGRTDYCGGFTAAIEDLSRPLFGTQFHPEKSQKYGLQLLKNYLSV